jgi:tetratricopeptide (TPR) repeat protein
MIQTNQAKSDQLADLEDAVTQHPSNGGPELQALADAYAERGRWADAVAAYKSAIALDPANADLYNCLGMAWDQIGKPEEAKAAFEQAAAINPNVAEAFYNLGSRYEEQHRLPEAIRAYEKCLNLTASRYERSVMMAKLGRLKRAQYAISSGSKVALKKRKPSPSAVSNSSAGVGVGDQEPIAKPPNRLITFLMERSKMSVWGFVSGAAIGLGIWINEAAGIQQTSPVWVYMLVFGIFFAMLGFLFGKGIFELLKLLDR